MISVIISPAKKLDFESPCDFSLATQPLFQKETDTLVKNLKKLKVSDLSKMMNLSQSLSKLNFERYQNFEKKYNDHNSKPAALLFDGDTYTGLEFSSLNKTQMKYAQKHLRILSGLYGVLRPMDLIQPYRLEMGTKFKFESYKNLYDLWRPKLASKLNEEMSEKDILVNCASNEYFKSIDTKNLKAKVITPVFKENKNGKLKVISFNAKRARGMMARFIIENKARTIEDLKKFSQDNYKFNKALSNESELVFTR
jgi:cytoplasmic iron level regulating protein YaaA (DUF328/UPF0246 family)